MPSGGRLKASELGEGAFQHGFFHFAEGFAGRVAVHVSAGFQFCDDVDEGQARAFRDFAPQVRDEVMCRPAHVVRKMRLRGECRLQQFEPKNCGAFGDSAREVI